MPVPAQFQLGLELTNIVNPLSQAISALGSLALVDAIKKSGSDAITEMKLASLIGRNRIDEVMKWHFREKVAKSDRSIISRYVDIVLESGAGPTVQEALKNPALFSMVIQLSALAFATEDESLANGIVEAIERIVKDSGRELEVVPDYVSLLGTIRACQQQTAAFRWAPLFEDVEWKIEKELLRDDTQEPQSTSHKPKRRRVTHVSSRNLSSVTVRALPFPALQSLIMWLQSLQSFPEHRLLHLRCDRGISTAVVWCHHVLGLTVSVNIQGAEITFGQGNSNIVIEECFSQSSGASLMDPADPNEPLFSLANDENHPSGSYERRAEAFGFGLKVLKNALGDTSDVEYCIHWIISHSIPITTAEKLQDVMDPQSQLQRLLRAAQFLFSTGYIDMTLVSSLSDKPFKDKLSSKVSEFTLVAILIAFARVEDDDLERGRQLPLSLTEYERIRKSQHGINSIDYLKQQVKPGGGRFEFSVNVLDAFSILSRLLLGHMYTEEYVHALLISAWGWSIFFDCIDINDPADVSIDKIRVLNGVPTRRGLRRTRIIDGPAGSQKLPSAVEIRVGNSQFRLFPGISTARKGRILVGYHSDAFQVTQSLIWKSFGKEEYTHRLAFRERLDQCVHYTYVLKPCDCVKEEPEDLLAWIDERLELGNDKRLSTRSKPDGQFYVPKWPKMSDQKYNLPERAFELHQKDDNVRGLWFYLSDETPSARWFLLGKCLSAGDLPPLLHFKLQRRVLGAIVLFRPRY